MMVGTGVVFAEPDMDQAVVRGLVIDPQEEELLRLQVRLELECGESKRGGFFG
jgi:hypothetical protein